MTCLETVVKKHCEQKSLDFLTEKARTVLMTGRIVFWCGNPPKELQKVKLYMTVVLGPGEHFCVMFRDVDCKFSLGQINLKNCKVLKSETDEKKFEVQLHVSEKTGLVFEASSREEAVAWQEALHPRFLSNSPAVSQRHSLQQRKQ